MRHSLKSWSTAQEHVCLWEPWSGPGEEQPEAVSDSRVDLWVMSLCVGHLAQQVTPCLATTWAERMAWITLSSQGAPAAGQSCDFFPGPCSGMEKLALQYPPFVWDCLLCLHFQGFFTSKISCWYKTLHSFSSWTLFITASFWSASDNYNWKSKVMEIKGV